MAKKAAAEKFNLSQAIRDAIAKNKSGSGKDIIEMVKAAHPGQTFNEKTALVSWSKLRKEAGGGKTSKKVKKPGRKPQGGTAIGNGFVTGLDAAIALVKAAGGTEQAKAVLDKLAEIQTPF
jgi:hypothetical protein